MKKIPHIVMMSVVFIAWNVASYAETLSYPDLVARLTDLERLSILPPKGENGALASSYDRASQYDAAQDKYIDWSANGDGGGIIRKEGENSVFAEIEGPGCIWRIWTATIGKGRVKIYLDGTETPAIDLPFENYFDKTTEPFTRPNLVYKTTANGYNNYTPIPFQKSCKIVAEKGWGNYYQFTYTKFAPGTKVSTFKLALGAEDLKALDRANQILGQVGQNPVPDRAGQKTEVKEVVIPAGGKAVVAELSGKSAITSIKVKSNWPQNVEAQRSLLAQLALSITWDDEKEPAVWAPLGDFFAASAGVAPFRTLPAGILDDGTFYSYWYMPFDKKAKIEVANDSGNEVKLSWEIAHAPLTKPIENLGRFHAKWHRDILPPREDRKIDWAVLRTEGRGRFVGLQLHVWNPRGGWWGEGDEKFYVDGEKFPSTFGTGSEDYFGYAWSSGKTFIQGLHSQAVNENNQGHVSVNRWHIADNIPFQTAYAADMEKYFTNDRPCLFAAVAYWYLQEGGKDPHGTFPVSERVGWWTRPDFSMKDGFIEGENLDWKDCSNQRMPKEWSNQAHVFCMASKVGEKRIFKFKPDKGGKYKLLVRLTKSHDYGIIQFSLNGNKLGNPIDGYAPKVSIGDPTDLGVVEVTTDEQVLGVEIMGKNPESTKYFVGIDWVKLEPAP